MVVWSPFRFNSGREMANRFAIAPLTTDSSHEDGTAPENELEFVRRRAASGFGATISSAAYVEQDGRSWQGIGAAHDGHLPSLHRLAEAMRAAGGLAILQIYDGGRIAKPELIGEQCLRAPSAVASLRPGAKTPRAMTSDEVASLIASFREAASLARKAGFDGVEIHGANHYAVHQFFSPRANHRVDHWGGTLAKRMNFPLAVAQAVRDALGPKLIAGFRVTPFEAERTVIRSRTPNCFVMNLPNWVSTTSRFRSMIIGRADLRERPVFIMVRSRKFTPRQRVPSRNLPAS